MWAPVSLHFLLVFCVHSSFWVSCGAAFLVFTCMPRRCSCPSCFLSELRTHLWIHYRLSGCARICKPRLFLPDTFHYWRIILNCSFLFVSGRFAVGCRSFLWFCATVLCYSDVHLGACWVFQGFLYIFRLGVSWVSLGPLLCLLIVGDLVVVGLGGVIRGLLGVFGFSLCLLIRGSQGPLGFGICLWIRGLLVYGIWFSLLALWLR